MPFDNLLKFKFEGLIILALEIISFDFNLTNFVSQPQFFYALICF